MNDRICPWNKWVTECTDVPPEFPWQEDLVTVQVVH